MGWILIIGFLATIWAFQTYPALVIGVVVVVIAGAYWYRQSRLAAAAALTGSVIMLDPPASGRFVEVVGENSYQGTLLQVAGGRTIDGAVVRDHDAVLQREPGNRYDRNAVAVLIGWPPGRVPEPRGRSPVRPGARSRGVSGSPDRLRGAPQGRLGPWGRPSRELRRPARSREPRRGRGGA